jgi:hypothetical protein
MKQRVSWLIIPAMALGLGACNKKEEVKAPDAPASVAETPAAPAVPAPAPVPVVPAVTAEERAAKLGFAKHLPQDTEMVFSFYNGSKAAERVKASKIWKLVEKEMGGGMMAEEEDLELDIEGAEDPAADQAEVAEPEADPAAEAPMGPAMLFGSEVTMAFGKASGEQAANLFTVNRRMGYFQMRGIAKAFVAAAKKGDASDLDSAVMEGYTSDLAAELLKDPQSGMALLERAKMPPLYVAFRVAEAQRPAAAQQIAAMLANGSMLGEMVEAVTTEKAGQKFEGYKISGAKISETLAETRKEMEEELDPATVDQLLAAVAKKDLVIVSGTIGDYVLLFIGSSLDDLALADGAEKSLAGDDALSFTNAYISKDIAALMYGDKEALHEIVTAMGGFGDMVNGLRDGIAGSDGLGDTRDLEALFKIVAEREDALRKMITTEAAGSVAFYEEGLKIESYGGTDNGVIDWKAPNKLAHLGDSADVVMFANMSADVGYSEKARAYAEALLETGYAIAMKVSEVPMEGADADKFKEMAKMFDSKFRSDLVTLWDAYSEDFGGSLGQERAMVIDLKGAAPAVPGIPQAVVDKAKVPRISFIAPVTDRKRLSASWDKMNTTSTSILAKVSEVVGQDIPMQKPMSTEKNGLTTWFFPMPFFNEDFLPSVTVGDQWFAASTSKNQAVDLITQAAAGTETRTGLWFTINFRALENYAKETSKVVDENAEALMGEPLTPKKRKMIKDSIAILSDLDKLTVHSRREGNVLRASVHFKTR